MFGGQGYYKGNSILISGRAGTGKTSLAAHFINAACARGERCIYFAFEESEQQVLRNMRSVGMDLGRWIEVGLLQFQATRPTTLGLEMHLVKMHGLVDDFDPNIVVVDPVTALLHSSAQMETRSMVLRMVDFLKSKQITAVMTTLGEGGSWTEESGLNISSLVDAWLVLQEIENAGERNRGIYILKARGMAHSNQIREFLLTNHGVELREVYLGSGEMIMGSARLAQEAKDASEAALLAQEIESKELLRERKRRAIEAQIAALQMELETEDQVTQQLIAQQETQRLKLAHVREAMAKGRSINVGASEEYGNKGKKSGGQK
jgi:circadian clock protein KaiC